MEDLEEFRKALRELQKAIESASFLKILITLLNWMEDRLENLSNRMRGGQE